MGEIRTQAEQSDADLVRMCLAGDNSAYDELVRRHQRLLYNFCYRMLGSGEDASDVVQEAFVKAYRALPCFRLDAPFGPWVHRIAHNLCIDRHRALKKAGCLSIEEVSEAGSEPADETISPPEIAEMDELGGTLRGAIAQLPPKYRAVVVMRHFEGLDIKEISAALRIPEGTVKASLHRARRMLREKLAHLEAIL